MTAAVWKGAPPLRWNPSAWSALATEILYAHKPTLAWPGSEAAVSLGVRCEAAGYDVGSLYLQAVQAEERVRAAAPYRAHRFGVIAIQLRKLLHDDASGARPVLESGRIEVLPE